MAYALTVGGTDIMSKVATDIAPIRWEAAGQDTVGSLSFTVIDDGTVSLPDGAVVRLADPDDTTLASGPLVDRRYVRGPGSLAFVEVEAVGWGWFLDKRIVPAFSYAPISGTITDSAIVLSLVATYGGPITASAATVMTTESYGGTDPTFALDPTVEHTLRGALEAVIGWVEKVDTTSPVPARHYFVDADKALHWYSGSPTTVGTAPARIGDGSYVRDVADLASVPAAFEPTAFESTAFGTTTRADITEYWPMNDAASGTATGLVSATAMVWTAPSAPDPTDLTTIGVINEPGYRSVLLNGTTSKGTVASGALTGTGDWSFECWFRHAAAITGTDTIYSGTAASSPLIRMLSTGKLDCSLKGGASEAASLTAWNDDEWHHLVVIHVAGVGGQIQVDGADDTAAMTARSFSASSGCTIGADGSSDFWAGYLQHVAVYGGTLGGGASGGSVLLLFGSGGIFGGGTAIAAGTARKHYWQGITYVPDGFVAEYASDAHVHAAWVTDSAGVTAGWVTHAPSGFSEYWPSGQTQMYMTDTDEFAGDNTVAQAAVLRARAELASRQRIDSARFETEHLRGWRPGQAVLIRDARLTDGEWVTQLAQSVEGELGPGSVLRHVVTTGAVSRSIVQALAGI